MPANQWQHTQPPHNTAVEVMHEGQIVEVRAIHGDPSKGILPHWESADGDTQYAPSMFSSWRFRRAR